MLKKYFVIISWSKLKKAEWASFGDGVVLMMRGNVYFVTPAVDPDELKKAIDRFTLAYNNRMNGLKAKGEFEAATADLDKLLRVQAAYVNTIAGGNKEIIASSGFVCSKGSLDKPVVPAQPLGFTAKFINGELILKTPAVKGAQSYCWMVIVGAAFPITVNKSQVEVDPKAKVIFIPAGNKNEIVYGLSAGMDISVMVLAQNPAGKSPWSPVVNVHLGS